MSKTKKPYWDMTTEELAQATDEFDREGIGDTFRDMTPAEEKAWRAAVHKRRGPGQLLDQGTKTIFIELPADLLKRVDALAKKRRISRARLVAASLEAMLTRKS